LISYEQIFNQANMSSNHLAVSNN